jgi:hypothetical protein
MLSFHFLLRLTKYRLTKEFPIKILYVYFVSPIQTICPAYRNVLYFTILTILSDLYKSPSSTLCKGAGIAQWYSAAIRARWSRFESRYGLGIFLCTTESRPFLGPTQPPIQWVSRALSLGVKWPGREADHSPPSSAEVKNVWSYTSTPPISLHDVVLC